MKQYVTATCALFGLLTLAHVWRLTQEPHLARDPWGSFSSPSPPAVCASGPWLSLERGAHHEAALRLTT